MHNYLISSSASSFYTCKKSPAIDCQAFKDRTVDRDRLVGHPCPRLFADDTCLVFNNQKLENLQTKIRTEVTKISKWLISNKLTLNFSKSNVMIIDPIKLKHLKNSYSDFTKLADIDMKNVNLVKYLGITLDKDLLFKFRINNL